jgi:hypothetical protein
MYVAITKANRYYKETVSNDSQTAKATGNFSISIKTTTDIEEAKEFKTYNDCFDFCYDHRRFRVSEK